MSAGRTLVEGLSRLQAIGLQTVLSEHQKLGREADQAFQRLHQVETEVQKAFEEAKFPKGTRPDQVLIDQDGKVWVLERPAGLPGMAGSAQPVARPGLEAAEVAPEGVPAHSNGRAKTKR